MKNKVEVSNLKTVIESEIKRHISEKSMISKEKDLNEFDLSRFTDPSRMTSFLSGVGASSMGVIKELLAQSFLEYLGVSPKSWFYGMIVNAFGNLDFQDIADLIHSEDYDACYNVTDALMKAFVETGIDKVSASFGVPADSLFARGIKEVLSDSANDKASPIYQAVAQTICDVDFSEVFHKSYQQALGIPADSLKDVAAGALEKEV